MWQWVLDDVVLSKVRLHNVHHVGRRQWFGKDYNKTGTKSEDWCSMYSSFVAGFSGFILWFQLKYDNHTVGSSWNVIAHGDARKGKRRGNWRMEWVASTLRTTSEHVVSSIRVQLKCDGTRWRTVGELKWKLANGVGSQYSSHYLGTWCIQHYSPVEMWWHTVTHGRGTEVETGECSG